MDSSLVHHFMRRKAMFGLPIWAVFSIGFALICAIILFTVLWLLVSRRQRRSRARVFIHKEDPCCIEEENRLTNPHCIMHQPFSNAAPPNHVTTEKGPMIEPGKTCHANNAAGFNLLDSQNGSDGTSFRAFNLDKADKEYKGKLFGRAKLAARGEEVRREIAANRIASRNSECVIRESMLSPHVEEEEEEEDEEQQKDCIVMDYSPLVFSSCVDSDLGWGYRYTQADLEKATNSFDDANVLGEGSHAIVYHGQLPDGTRIALRKLINNGEQADKEFRMEVEAIGRVRHKNLVGLIGYCMEGSQRMLVYEYIDNGNLEQWLHGPLGDLPPLSWDIRMKIIIGTAKGLAYLHEGLEPKVIHRDVKSSNILLDSQWNAKVSDFGLAKLLSADHAHITTMVMGTFGYVAPEYASTGKLTEKSDVFSYGVLVMELVTGNIPVDVNRKPGEVNIVDWLKTMVSARRLDEVVDEKMKVKPSSRGLKRVLLVALRCVDPDPEMRPKMSHVVHMLELADHHHHRHHDITNVSNSPQDATRGHHMNRASEAWR